MKRLAYILFLFVCCNSGTKADKNELLVLENQSMYSHILGQDVKYAVCLPNNYYQSGKSFPVVYMLHGLGDQSSSWLEYGQIDLYAKQAVDKGRIIPMIYIMPEGYRTYYVNDFYRKFLYQDMFIKELIPHIDSLYRTISDSGHRATIGYSMGGFGALMLPVKNPNYFRVAVPLSISVRTDQQYETEDTSGWDEQWGRLFGGINSSGAARLTEYYKQNSPFHAIQEQGVKKLKIFILNGDDEYTLARSNEELHILMRDLNIPHEYRVRNGGHEFSFWKESLTDGLDFISDAFENKPYRGDIRKPVQKAQAKLQMFESDGKQYSIYLPPGYEQSNRLYPVMYVESDLSGEEKAQFAGITQQQILEMKTPPQIIIFTNSKQIISEEWMNKIASKFRIRNSWRFRTILGYKTGGSYALQASLIPEMFSCAVSFDATISSEDSVVTSYKNVNKQQVERTWFYIDTPDKGSYYSGNGMLHIIMREKEIVHEYRVREGKGEVSYLFDGLPQALEYIGNKLHK